jgi:hypothetical protein
MAGRLVRSVAANARRPSLLDVAVSILDLAREEMAAGYDLDDDRRVRDAAEKAWLAALQAIDFAMSSHGLYPQPGPMAHESRHRFLKRAGREDLSRQLSYFADQLHGQVFYIGSVPPRDKMHLAIDEVAQFVRVLGSEV